MNVQFSYELNDGKFQSDFCSVEVNNPVIKRIGDTLKNKFSNARDSSLGVKGIKNIKTMDQPK